MGSAQEYKEMETKARRKTTGDRRCDNQSSRRSEYFKEAENFLELKFINPNNQEIPSRIEKKFIRN